MSTNPTAQLPPIKLENSHLCLAAFISDVRGAVDDYDAKQVCRLYVNNLGPKVLGVLWMHEKAVINHLMYRGTTKTLMALVRGLIDYLPTPPLPHRSM